MGRPSLDDYVDVAERIELFKQLYPEGSLQTVSYGQMALGGTDFVVYQAAAYRTPDDQRPGQGVAWEKVPGGTPYTKDSELMNAETAAWGRACVALGIGAKRGSSLASRQEVQARMDEEPAEDHTSVDAARPASPQIPLDRAKTILESACACELAYKAELNGELTVTLAPVFKAKLADVGVTTGKIADLNVDQAEDVEAFLAEEKARVSA